MATGANGWAVMLAAFLAISGAGGEDASYSPETFTQTQLADLQTALDLTFPEGVRGEYLFQRNRGLDPAGAAKLSVPAEAVAPLLEELARHPKISDVHISSTLTAGLEWWTPEAGEVLEERHYFLNDDGYVGVHVVVVREGEGAVLFAEWYCM